MSVKHLRVNATKELMERRIIVDWEGYFPLVWVMWSVIERVVGGRSRDRRLGGNCAAFELLDSCFGRMVIYHALMHGLQIIPLQRVSHH